MSFLLGFVALLIFQLAGEVIVILFELPVSGPVVGLFLLFIGLVIKGTVNEHIEFTATNLLSHLSLLFIPAGVGLMMHYELLQKEWLAISVTLIVSTIVMLISTAVIMMLCNKLFASESSHDV